MSVIERCPYYRGVRKERLDCSCLSMRRLLDPLLVKEKWPFSYRIHEGGAVIQLHSTPALRTPA